MLLLQIVERETVGNVSLTMEMGAFLKAAADSLSSSHRGAVFVVLSAAAAAPATIKRLN